MTPHLTRQPGQSARPARRTPLQVLVAGASVAFALVAVGTGAVSLLGRLAGQQMAESRAVETSPRRLEVLVDGAVRISPSPDGRVHVRHRSGYSFVPPRFSEVVAGDTLVLRAHCASVPARCWIDYDVQVPVDALSEVDARAIAGDMDARGLRARRVEARGAARTELSFDAAPERVVAAGHRNVNVLLPYAPEGYRVASDEDWPPNRRIDGSVGPGDADEPGYGYSRDMLVGVRVNPASPRLIDASSSGGSVRITSR